MTNGEEQRAIVYSEELGVAIEQLKPCFTIADLWEINIDAEYHEAGDEITEDELRALDATQPLVPQAVATSAGH